MLASEQHMQVASLSKQDDNFNGSSCHPVASSMSAIHPQGREKQISYLQRIQGPRGEEARPVLWTPRIPVFTWLELCCTHWAKLRNNEKTSFAGQPPGSTGGSRSLGIIKSSLLQHEYSTRFPPHSGDVGQ